MRRRLKVLAFVIIAIALSFSLTGCTSVGAFIKANISGLPFWYYEPSVGVGRGNTGLVGTGKASTERQAELLAYSDIMDKLSVSLGYDLSQEVYRELSVLGTITQFKLSIADRSTSLQDGQVVVHLHAVMDKELIEQATSEESKRRAALTEEIENLVLEGDEFVKSGMEIKAIRNYLKAMSLGIGEDYIDDEYSFDSLYDVIVELLDKISITILSPKPSTANCTVYITRKGTFVSSAVVAADVLASYTAVDARGKTYQDSFVFLTNEDGQFPFISINPTISRIGTVRFSLNLTSDIDALYLAEDQEKVQRLRELVDSKSVEFNYSKTYAMGSIATSVIEHDSLGYVTGNKDISDYLADKMAKDGATAAAFYPELDDEEDVLYEFQHSGRSEEYLLVIRVGFMDTVKSEQGLVAVNVEGLVTLFNCKSSAKLYQSEILYSTAFGETESEALKSAFKTLADIALTLIKAEYV